VIIDYHKNFSKNIFLAVIIYYQSG